VSGGREFAYTRRKEQGCLVGGRLDIPRTAALRARGMGDRVAFERTILTNVTPLNRVLAAALREVEFLNRTAQVSERDLATARTMSMYFADCATDPRRRWQALATADELLADNPRPRHHGLVSLAAILLAHESLEPEDVALRAAPRSWFVNLEQLFERAVRETLNDLAEPMQWATKGVDWRQPIYTSRPPMDSEGQNEREVADIANPDVVLAEKPDRVVAVGDVKYKVWTGKATRSDLYQLLVHAAAFGCRTSFLVYPHDSFEEVDLGPSKVGSSTRLFALDVMDLPAQTARLLEVLRRADEEAE